MFSPPQGDWRQSITYFCKVTPSSNNSNLLNAQARRGSSDAASDRKGPDEPVPSPKKEVRTEAADGQARRKRVLFSEETGKGSQMRWQGEWKGMSVRRNSTSKASNTAEKAERARNTVNLQERQERPEPEYAGLLTPMLTQAQWHNGRMLSEGATGSNGSHLAETLRPNVVLNIHSASLKTH